MPKQACWRPWPFFRDPLFAQTRFARLGDVFETSLIGQRLVFIRGDAAITDLLSQSDAVEGWWPDSVRRLLGSRSLANRNGAAHKARRRVVGQLFSAAALQRYSPAIIQLVDELAAKLASSSSPRWPLLGPQTAPESSASPSGTPTTRPGACLPPSGRP